MGRFAHFPALGSLITKALEERGRYGPFDPHYPPQFVNNLHRIRATSAMRPVFELRPGRWQAGVILCALALIPGLNWTRKRAWLAAGIVVVILGDVVPVVQIIGAGTGLWGLVGQAAPIPGFAMLGWAARMEK
jgi:hypothetical protein